MSDIINKNGQFMALDDGRRNRSVSGSSKTEKCGILFFFVAGTWVILCCVSLNHMTLQIPLPMISTSFLGVFYLSTLLWTMLYMGKAHLKALLGVFCIFFILNCLPGPFLEPPADPLDHIRSSYQRLEPIQIEKIKKVNQGFWHYNATSFFLGIIPDSKKGIENIRILQIIHGVYCGMLGMCIYLSGIRAGLPMKWSLLTCCVAFVFWGTNKFSYFSYYSFGPSFTAILIYWIWVNAFFLSEKWTLREFISGMVAGLLVLPVIVVNHIQEGAFLGFIFTFFGLWMLHNKIIDNRKKKLTRAWYIFLIIVLFVLPQFDLFRDTIGQHFVINHWEKNQSHVLYVGPFHLMGNIWQHRVNDTLGLMGFLPAGFLLALIFPNVRKQISEKDVKIWMLGILPLLIYCVPLFHFIWLANCQWKPTHVRYYYRICYASFFWLTLAYACYRIEPAVVRHIRNYATFSRNEWFFNSTGQHLWFIVVCVIVVGLGTVRSAPFYGKLDFIYSNTRPWWPSMRKIVTSIDPTDKRKILTDPVTSKLLSAVFNFKVVPTYRKPKNQELLNIEELDTLSINKKYQVIINLRGFEPTWVPKETGHWRSTFATTSNFYTYSGQSGPQIIPLIKNYKPKHLRIAF